MQQHRSSYSAPIHQHHCPTLANLALPLLRRWPGQVWDAGKATSQQLRIRRAGQLVVFFGDNSFGWFPAELLVDFAEHLEEKAKQKTGNKARGWPWVRFEPQKVA